MSIKAIISKIWNAIRSLFNSFEPKLKLAVQIGIVVTQNIKKFVDSPLVDALTSIIPGELDDKIKQALRQNIPLILANLNLAASADKLYDPEKLTECAIKTLHTLEGNVKSAFLHNISVMIAQVAADGKLSWSDGVCILEWYYQNNYKTALK